MSDRIVTVHEGNRFVHPFVGPDGVTRECRTESGQPFCSCGYYILDWRRGED